MLEFVVTMKGKACLFRSLFTIKSVNVDLLCYNYRHIILSTKTVFFSTSVQYTKGSPKSSVDVLRMFGFSESNLDKLLSRQPSLRNANATKLEDKLTLLRNLGISTSQLVQMIYCRPRFLFCRLNLFFDERLDGLLSLFGSKEILIKAIVRNPSLLVYDLFKDVQPVFSLYEKMGITRRDLISMLILRPTLISRTNMSPDKLDYISRTGVMNESKMFKYLVTIIGVSRFETIREKVENLEKFGFSEDEVLKLYGRSPLLITLSMEKVQRNMTFVIGTMKQPAKVVYDYPFLLFFSLEAVLKPRVSLAAKMRDMDLNPQMNGNDVFRALRMSENRFLKVYVHCQEEEVRNELLSFYTASKGTKRLAESSKKASYTPGFPF